MTIKIEVDIAAGYYCKKDGVRHCTSIECEEGKVPGCRLFSRALRRDGAGNILKCDKCLIAERDARAEE